MTKQETKTKKKRSTNKVEEVDNRTPIAMALDENVMLWEKEYGKIFKTVIEDDIYIWRKLKRTEYKEITRLVSDMYPDDTQAQNWLRQEEITNTVLLYPFDAEEAIEEAAGICVVISQDCLVRSGFGAISTQYNENLR